MPETTIWDDLNINRNILLKKNEMLCKKCYDTDLNKVTMIG